MKTTYAVLFILTCIIGSFLFTRPKQVRPVSKPDPPKAIKQEEDGAIIKIKPKENDPEGTIWKIRD